MAYDFGFTRRAACLAKGLTSRTCFAGCLKVLKYSTAGIMVYSGLAGKIFREVYTDLRKSRKFLCLYPKKDLLGVRVRG